MTLHSPSSDLRGLMRVQSFFLHLLYYNRFKKEPLKENCMFFAMIDIRLIMVKSYDTILITVGLLIDDLPKATNLIFTWNSLQHFQ